MNWTISVIIICIALALFAIWQEYRRSNRIHLLWRVVACLIAVAALACIILPISYQGQTQTAEGNNAAALLTEGYSADSITHNYKYIFTTDKNVQKAYPKATLLNHLQEASTYQPAIKSLHILGYGLDKVEVQELGNVPAVYHAPALPAGIQAINWPGKLKSGEALQVQGTYHNTSSKTVKLVLQGLNTGLDSINIPAQKTVDFDLSTKPKSTGRITFNLVATAGKDSLVRETLPVIIEPVKPVKILMLSASPDFETDFLKNWPSSNGYAVAARAVISKDKISQDYVNMGKLSLTQLTPALLAQFDAIIGDLSALKSLSPSESAALKQQVTQNGLGAMVRADSSDKSVSWLQRDFPVTTIPAKAQLTVALRLQNQPDKTAALNIDPAYIGQRNNTQNLVYDAQNHIMANSALAGAGRLVFTTLNHTYTWMLSGNGKDYSALWSLLVGKAVRKAAPADSWIVTSATPSVNEPVQLQYQGTVLPSLTINQSAVAPVQNALVPYEWNVTYWPQKAGWQRITTNSNVNAYWYAYTKTDWNTLKSLKKMADTKNYVENQPKIKSVTKQIQQSVQIEVPKIYFYLILLAACTFLWIERKLTV